MAELRHCSLFSGIGGFDLGLDRAGIETVMVCENDADARAVLKRRFGEVRYRKSVECRNAAIRSLSGELCCKTQK